LGGRFADTATLAAAAAGFALARPATAATARTLLAGHGVGLHDSLSFGQAVFVVVRVRVVSTLVASPDVDPALEAGTTRDANARARRSVGIAVADRRWHVLVKSPEPFVGQYRHESADVHAVERLAAAIEDERAAHSDDHAIAVVELLVAQRTYAEAA